MPIWFLRGLPDDSMMKAWINSSGKVQFSTGGSINMQWQMARFFKLRLHIVGAPIPDDRPSMIVNELSSPETHTRALRDAHEMCQQIQVPVINRPDRIMGTTRDKVANALAGIDRLIVPRTIVCTPRSPDDVMDLIAEHNLGPQTLIRETGTHGGKTMVRISGPEDYPQLHQLAFDGREFYMGEYIEYQDSDGLYRKMRVVNIGDRIRPRHCLMADNWMIHAAARQYMDAHPELNAQENTFMDQFDRVTRPILDPIFAQMRERLGLEYFGADCHLFADGRLLLFEANANMNVTENTGIDKSIAAPHIERIAQDFRKLMIRTLKTTANG
jgi:glutathione synthase/RimK-type ligase-like ATP-grasp enzyme